MEYEDLHEIIKKISSSESESGFLDSNWSLIPEDILVRIFRSIPVKDILSCSEACKRWNFISQDTLLWKYKFQTDFKLKKNISIKPGRLKGSVVLTRSSYDNFNLHLIA